MDHGNFVDHMKPVDIKKEINSPRMMTQLVSIMLHPISVESYQGGTFMRNHQHLSAESCRTYGAHTYMGSAKSDSFRKEVCQVYDLMIASGIEHSEAIRKTRSTLKAINYPFVTYDYVVARLRASGRLRKTRSSGSENS